MALVLLLAVASDPAVADLTISRGGADCSDAVNEITRNWREVRRFMAPKEADLDRAKSEDFYCVSRESIVGALERRGLMTLKLRCFSDPEARGLDICCDEAVNGCARLNPAYAPEPQKPVKPTKRKSDWIRPPTDADQWKTVEEN